MTGIVTANGPALRHAGVTVQLPVTRTPLGEAVAAMVAAIDAGEIVACPHCGRYACECEQPSADPHDDLAVWQDCEIPF